MWNIKIPLSLIFVTWASEVSKFKGQMGIPSLFGGFSAKECALPWLKLS